MPRRETSPEVHAAECGGGHKLSVMAVTKRRFLGRRGVDLPRNTLPQDVTASLTGSAGYYWFGSQSASLVEFPLPAYLNWNAGVTLTRKIFNLDLHQPVEGRLLRFTGDPNATPNANPNFLAPVARPKHATGAFMSAA